MELSQLGKQLDAMGILIHFEAMEEDINPADMFDDDEIVSDIIKRAGGDIAAWFTAKVWLTYAGISSDADYLGACSYASLDQFTSTDNDYFDSMLRTCYKDLQKLLTEAKKSPDLKDLLI